MSDCREQSFGDEILGARRAPYDTPEPPYAPAKGERPTRQARAGRPEQGGGAPHPFRTRQERKPVKPVAQGARPNFSIEGYDMLECRGKGGMGQVYRAIQKSLGREVAIKTLDLGLAKHQASIMRFTKEAAAMARLRHPNIVQVIDRGSSRQRHYFVMEFVDGPSLRELLREGAFAPPEALQIMLQLARTMAYAHKQGVIHRDLKPENILYTSDGVLKVADFGLAGVEAETTHIRKLTRSFVSMGTECYMAPEQRRDAKNVDFRADLYSMGVIFFELLTNQLPFPQMPPPHRVIAPGYPIIDQIIRRCLEPIVEDRYGSTEALVSALEEGLELAQQPVVHRDTVIDTPGVVDEERPAPPAEGAGLLEERLSGWSGRVKSVISEASSHVSMTWQSGPWRKWFVSTASLVGLVAVVGLAFSLFPAPPVPKVSDADKKKLIWTVPAAEQSQPDGHNILNFKFDLPSRASTWRRRRRPLWRLKGNWSASGNMIQQNTYERSVILNVGNRWAIYKGHQLLPKRPTKIEAQVKFLKPMVPFNGKLVSLQKRLSEKKLLHLRQARRPTIGLGLHGKRGQQIACLLAPKGNKVAYRLYVRRRLEDKGTLPIRFHYDQPLHVVLQLTKEQATLSVDGKEYAKIGLLPQDQWPASAGVACRDAHCVFKHLEITASSQNNDK